MENGIFLDILLALDLEGMEITFDTFFVFFVLIQMDRIDAFWTVYAPISLCDSKQNSSLFCEDFRCPISYITETLNNEFLALETWL